MHPLEDATLDQLAQVPADGLLGHREVRGQRTDLHPAVGAGTDQDLSSTLVRLHRDPSSTGLACDVGHVASLHEGTGIAEPGWACQLARFM